MATPMIEQFPKGTLNKCWHYIDLCKYVHPELTGTIDRMRDMLIRYTLIKPWPLRGDAPECFHVRFLPKEQNDFFFYYGLGYGLEAQMQEAELPKEHFDLEKAIVDCRLDYVRRWKHSIEYVRAVPGCPASSASQRRAKTSRKSKLPQDGVLCASRAGRQAMDEGSNNNGIARFSGNRKD